MSQLSARAGIARVPPRSNWVRRFRHLVDAVRLAVAGAGNQHAVANAGIVPEMAMLGFEIGAYPPAGRRVEHGHIGDVHDGPSSVELVPSATQWTTGTGSRSNGVRVARLRRGEMPIYEPGLESILRDQLDAARLTFTASLAEGLADAEVVFIAVGTPCGEDGSADLSHVMAVAEQLGAQLRQACFVVNSWPCMPIAPTRPRSSPPSTKRRLASDASTSWSTMPPSSPSVRWKSCRWPTSSGPWRSTCAASSSPPRRRSSTWATAGG